MTLTRRQWLAGSAGLVAGSALSGCGSEPVPRDSYYRLDRTADVTPLAGGPIAGTVEVAPFRAEGILNDSALLYREGQALSQYSYHFWLEPPTAMLSRAFVDALRAAQAFTTVATPEMRLDRDYELIGSLRALEQVIGTGVVLALDLSLRRVRDNRELLLKSYRAEERTESDSPEAAVSAFSRALDRVIAQFLGDLAQVPKEPPKDLPAAGR
jgi:ABC-type uncharacterized transport system auxiliary subunit